MSSSTLISKLGDSCNVLRDDGMSYHDYIEQLTYRLFLKTADERSRAVDATICNLHHMTRAEIWDAGKYKDKDGDIIERYPDGSQRVRFHTVVSPNALFPPPPGPSNPPADPSNATVTCCKDPLNFLSLQGLSVVLRISTPPTRKTYGQPRRSCRPTPAMPRFASSNKTSPDSRTSCVYAAQAGISSEMLAAKVCGRWRNGSPLELMPDSAGSVLPVDQLNDFTYVNTADPAQDDTGPERRRGLVYAFGNFPMGQGGRAP